MSMQASTIFSENFDEATPALGVQGAVGTAGFTTISGTQVDIFGAGLYGFDCLSPESVNCVDLNGSTNFPGNLQGGLTATINAPSAGIYVLSYDLVGNSNGISATAEVTLGSVDDVVTLGPTDNVDGIVSEQVILAAGANTLTIQSDTPGTDGLRLDNVSVVSTPEPASILLLGSGLLAGSLIRKRVIR
jgi:hypothetical protein